MKTLIDWDAITEKLRTNERTIHSKIEEIKTAVENILKPSYKGCEVGLVTQN